MTVRIGRAYAQAFLERLGVHERSDLKTIASRIGLSVEEADTEGFEGALVRPIGGKIGVIVLSRSIRELGRRNFTLAHEIGHFLLPGHDTEERVCLAGDLESWGNRLDRRELDANEFAAELLVPTFLLEPRIRSTEPGFGIIGKLAQEFSASLTATARRFVEVTTHRCAVVWSTRDRISWYARSQEFGHHVNVGERLDRGSLAYKCLFEGQRQAGPMLVPAHSWLPEHNLLPDARVSEESLLLPFYESALSLLWITERIEERTEWDEEESEEALDPDEFTLARQRWPRK
jgi:IrrE N-terminal-like domain